MAITWSSTQPDEDEKKKKNLITWQSTEEAIARRQQSVELERRKQQAISDIQKQKEEKTPKSSSIFERAKQAISGIFKKEPEITFKEAKKQNLKEGQKSFNTIVDTVSGKTAKDADQKKRGLISGNRIIPAKKQEDKYISDSYYLEKKKQSLENGGMTVEEKLFGSPLKSFTGKGVTEQPIGKVAEDIETSRQQKFQEKETNELTEITRMLEDENYKPEQRSRLAEAFKLEEDLERGTTSLASGILGVASNVVDTISWAYESAGGDATNLRKTSDTINEVTKTLTPEDQKLYEKLLTGAGSMAGFAIIGGGVGTTIQGIGKVNATTAWLLGKATEWGLEGITESASVYEENRKKGLSKEDSNKRALGVLAGNVVLNATLGALNIGAEKLPYFNQLLKYPINGFTEGSQEIVQQYISNIATDKNPTEGVFESGLVGGLLGVLTGGLGANAVDRSTKQFTEQDIYDIEEAIKAEVEDIPDSELTITPERKKEIIDNLPKEIRDNLDELKPVTEVETVVSQTQQEEVKTPQETVETVKGEVVPTEVTTPVVEQKKEEKVEQVTPEDKLVEEARKYKSAEEFVKAQPVYYHQSQSKKEFSDFLQKGDKGYKKADYSQAGEGIYFSNNKELVKSKYGEGGGVMIEANINPKNLLDLGEYDAMYFNGKKVNYGEIVVDNFKRFQQGLPELPEPDIILTGITKKAKNWLQKNGYDAVKGMEGEIHGGNELVVLDKNIIKTKSQLTDIWNKAQEKPKAGTIVSKKEAVKKAGVVTEAVKATNEELDIPTPKGVRRKITPEIAQEAETKAIEGGTGKEKIAKKAKLLQELMPEAEIDVEDTSFNSVNTKQDRANAALFTAQNPERAVRVSKGFEPPPPNISRTSIQLAVLADARSRNDNSGVGRSAVSYLQRGSRTAQELALRESFDINNEMFWMQDLYRERLTDVAKKQGWVYDKDSTKKFTKQQTVQESLNNTTQEVSKKINKEAKSKIESAQKFLDSLTCKT